MYSIWVVHHSPQLLVLRSEIDDAAVDGLGSTQWERWSRGNSKVPWIHDGLDLLWLPCDSRSPVFPSRQQLWSRGPEAIPNILSKRNSREPAPKSRSRTAGYSPYGMSHHLRSLSNSSVDVSGLRLCLQNDDDLKFDIARQVMNRKRGPATPGNCP